MRVLVPLTALALLAGCPDPKGRFDDFSNQIPDGGGGPVADANGFEELPDLSGTFYVTVQPFQSGKFLHLLWTTTMTIDQASQTGTLSYDQRLLSDTGNGTPRDPVGDTVHMADIAVNRAGQFTIQYNDLVVPAAANPINNTDFTADLTLEATIVDANGFCGVITHGMTSLGTPLDGTPFVGRRVPAGQTGAALPPPTSECSDIQPSMADAGPVDAASPDAN